MPMADHQTSQKPKTPLQDAKQSTGKLLHTTQQLESHPSEAMLHMAENALHKAERAVLQARTDDNQQAFQDARDDLSQGIEQIKSSRLSIESTRNH